MDVAPTLQVSFQKLVPNMGVGQSAEELQNCDHNSDPDNVVHKWLLQCFTYMISWNYIVQSDGFSCNKSQCAVPRSTPTVPLLLKWGRKLGLGLMLAMIKVVSLYHESTDGLQQFESSIMKS